MKAKDKRSTPEVPDYVPEYEEYKEGPTPSVKFGDKSIFNALYVNTYRLEYWTAHFPLWVGDRGAAFWRDHWQALASVLTSSGVQASTSEAVLNDYRDVLTGRYKLSATPEQMKEVIDKCDALAFYEVDSIGAYYALYSLYRNRLNLCRDYEKYVSIDSPTATLETRREFFIDNMNDIEALNLHWLLGQQKIHFEDLQNELPDGITDIQESPRYLFFRSCNFTTVGVYLLFYIVARHALNMTKEEVQGEVSIPYIVSQQDDFLQEAEAAASEIMRKVEADGESLKERKALSEEAQKNKGSKQKYLCFPYPFVWLGTGPLLAARTSSKDDLLLTFSYFVEEIKANDEEVAKLMRFTGGRGLMVLDGVNMMINSETPNIIGDRYVFELPAAKFARYAGSKQPHRDEMQSNYETLKLFNSKFYEIHIPKGQFTYTITKSKGRKRKGDIYETERRPLLFLTKTRGANNEVYRIEIERDLIDSFGQVYVLREAYERARSKRKGESFRRFLNQIALKDRKREEEMRNEVFGWGEVLEKIAKAEEESRAKLSILIEQTPDLKAGGLSANDPIEKQTAKIVATLKGFKESEGRPDNADEAEREKRLNRIMQAANIVAELKDLASRKDKVERKRTNAASDELATLAEYFGAVKDAGLLTAKAKRSPASKGGGYVWTWTKPQRPRLKLEESEQRQLPDGKK